MSDSPNRRLRALIARKKAVLLPGAANALAARVIEDLGFEAIYVTGAGVTNTFLGMPDIGLLTVTELADHVAAMRDAVSLPLIVDADTGFGNAVNVGRTVRTLERAGASAIQLEDQDFPKRCGHFSGKSVIPTAEMVQKIRAAADARVDRDFVIVTRTDAIAVNGFEDAMARANAFIEAGADMTFVEAPRTPEQIAAIPKLAVPQLLNIVAGGLTPMLPRAELETMGYALVLYANAALQAAVAGMQTVLGHLKAEGSLDGVSDKLAGFAERQRLVNKPHFDALEKKYS
ncbi:MAG TPA: oxaloacetate decarboxylase [Pseudolabrys sp.]|uniref:isocitrate lyase/PEP mutase family protein n=1 Tax=Pseudolabrys sp. TaxID=1960880 RepID=UPI002DDD8CC5|nr:oxaloacetate decarboxylase [Pseudolabrys sp.]HEV2630553.1 oxaloacetate decarboxylase [Pseudolabrys sp.]